MSQGMYGFLFALNIGGVALNFYNMRSARLLGESQTGNVIALVLCVVGAFWSGQQAFH